MSDHKSFKKWKYHAEKPACIVDTDEAENAPKTEEIDS